MLFCVRVYMLSSLIIFKNMCVDSNCRYVVLHDDARICVSWVV